MWLTFIRFLILLILIYYGKTRNTQINIDEYIVGLMKIAVESRKQLKEGETKWQLFDLIKIILKKIFVDISNIFCVVYEDGKIEKNWRNNATNTWRLPWENEGHSW